MGDGHEKYIIAIFGILLTAQWGLYASLHSDISSLHTDIGSVRDDIGKMDKSLQFVKYRLGDRGCAPFHGNIAENNTTRYISISSPVNGSKTNKTISVKGKANLHEGDLIYIISKIDKDYWVSMDCSISSNGEWEGARDCIIPTTKDNGSKLYEIFAIVTDPENLCRVGDSYDNVPSNLARSDSIYITHCGLA